MRLFDSIGPNPHVVRMFISELGIDIEKIEVEISIISKELAKLNVKTTTRQSFRPHEFKSNKKRLSQLLGCVNYMNRLNKFK